MTATPGRGSRPRGVLAYPMPREVAGPEGGYALVLHPASDEARMVHTEGVAYLVNTHKPWTWNDYDRHARFWSIGELTDLIATIEPVDLADWVREHNTRLESNFHQAYWWATHGKEGE